MQLCVNDPLDEKKAHPEPTTEIHRRIRKKSHDLVIYVNNHKNVHEAFVGLACTKRKTEEGARMFESLVEDVVTRWDSELMMFERLYYFDRELLTLFSRADLGIPADMALDRLEFDIMHAMTLVLGPFRIFTKEVQHKSKVTLAYVPKMIDDLVEQLRPGSFNARLQGCAPGTLAASEAFQVALVTSLKTRFADVFNGDSLALAARHFLPGKDLFTFQHFPLAGDVLEVVRDNIISDVIELLPRGTSARQQELFSTMARLSLEGSREELDALDPTVDSLEFWPQHPNYTVLFPVAKMYLQIPASSAENERSFSSASFILDPRRTRVELDNFRREHRLRRFLLSGNPQFTAQGLMERYAIAVEDRRAAQPDQ